MTEHAQDVVRLGGPPGGRRRMESGPVHEARAAVGDGEGAGNKPFMSCEQTRMDYLGMGIAVFMWKTRSR
ncbi:hypothetical protein BJ981_000731 [Sphaerisporangium krabiense]|uniref:Uncharacterized protein n=1 Tax=Sphaerisporangium krabiense TaxID=763782 RepID=A0A7W8Z058_9ACTN|nr:hypothetical protein [Sphaerisporangium krabiense]